VVITGMGIVTTVGDSLDRYFDALVTGRSGIGLWKRGDQRYAKIGADMSDFDIHHHFDRNAGTYPPDLVQAARRLLRSTPLSGRLTTIAALQAFVDAGFVSSAGETDRLAHVLGGHNLNMRYIYENSLVHHAEPDYIDPLYGLMVFDTDVLATISELLSVRGPSFSVGTACASGGAAALAGLDLLRAGRADVVVVTGAALDLDAAVLDGWALMNALSFESFNADPTRASRPFDARREGFVPSEGAGAIVIESVAHARLRGARVYAELLGASCTSDASRLPKPHLEGQVNVMRNALRDAHVDCGDVDYVNAHATSTPLGDASEVGAIKTVFGHHAYEIPVNSTKSIIGHCLTSAGIIEIVATVLQMRHGVVHPTINQEEPDPELDLDFVPNEARDYRMNVAISNSFGFGGLNACVVLGRTA
jgi:3-oxoacyl-(acyl-carrier-protein) synthase